MRLNHSITEIIILVLLWVVGIALMILVMKRFCSETRSELDSQFETDDAVKPHAESHSNGNNGM